MLRDSIFTYKDFSMEEVVDLKMVESVISRVRDRGKWYIVDRSDNVVVQVDYTIEVFFNHLFELLLPC